MAEILLRSMAKGGGRGHSFTAAPPRKTRMDMLALAVTVILSMVIALAATGTILWAAISVFERTAVANRRAVLAPDSPTGARILHS
jgi:hypothetical protein